MNKLKDILKYILVGDPSKRTEMPVINASTNENMGLRYEDTNPSVFERVGQVFQGKPVPTQAPPMATNPSGLGGISAALATPPSTPVLRKALPTVTPTPFLNSTDQILAKYALPLPLFYGMRDAEGGVIGQNNVMNMNATDSNPSGAYDYPTPEAGIEDWARTIAESPRYSKAYQVRQDPVAMLEQIALAGYAGDPKTWKQRSIAQGGAGKTYDTYPQFVMDTPGWKKNYKK